MDLASAQEPYAEHFRKFEEWLDAGRAATMGYLPRGRDRRRDPLRVFPSAKSVFCVAVPYSAAPHGFTDQTKGPLLARYLRGGDYHSLIAERMNRMLESVAKKLESQGHERLRWKTCVDTSAVLERAWCSLAGLGWIGKNSMLMHPTHGSYLLLGVAFLDQETGCAPSPLRSLCGSCRNCLEGCPTKALVNPGELDANRCISYWTLEKRGPVKTGGESRMAIGSWVAGCDLCQEACPFNAKVTKRALSDPTLPDNRLVQSWEFLLKESPENYEIRVSSTALNRVKPTEWRRNLQLAHESILGDRNY